MIDKQILRLAARRFLLLLVISLLFVGAMSEAAYYFLKSDADRPPQEVELVIPPGTAAKVAAGEEEPAIPSGMTFVMGDTLIVRNQDSIDHQLGSLRIPAGASASMLLEEVNNYALASSFHPSQYFSLDVRERTTLNLRLIALIYVTPATVAFLFVYSLILFPLKPRVVET